MPDPAPPPLTPPEPFVTPDLAAVRDALGGARSVVMTTHQRPDGDALGSEIALARALLARGTRVLVLNADGPPRNLDWLVEQQPPKLVRTFVSGSVKQARAVAEADALVVLDANARKRLGAVGDVFAQAGKPVLLLDHHPEPEAWFTHACVRVGAAATCEIVYDLLASLDPGLIDAGTATALYTGLMTDTGSFRYSGTSARTHAIAADLLARGVVPEPVHIAMFDGRSPASLRLLSAALASIGHYHDGRVATMTITQATLNRSGAFFDETEGLVNYALALDGVVAAVIFLELPGGVKMSFRSTGTVAINGWAGLFGGGGHANAAGAYVDGATVRELLPRVVDAAPDPVAFGPVAPVGEDAPLSDADRALLEQFTGKL